MAATVSTRVVWDRKAVAELRLDPGVRAYIQSVGEQVAHDMRVLAPRDSGAGAASILARDSRSKGATDVGWDKEHYYLIFPEYGTVHQPAQRFAHEALYESQPG